MGKICRICNILKDIELFTKRDEFKYRSECKECNSEIKKKRHIKNKMNPEYVEKLRESSRDYKSKNKEIVREKRKEHYKNNKEHVLELSKIYYINNREKKMNKRKEYRLENKDILNEKMRNYKKDNHLYRMTCNIRTLISNSLRKNGYTKKSRTYEILGCSYIEFKEYLESLFLEGMSWNNRNEWHIDHIIPLSFAENENELLLLNSYKNLRPLWCVDNLIKGNIIESETNIYNSIIESRISYINDSTIFLSYKGNIYY